MNRVALVTVLLASSVALADDDPKAKAAADYAFGQTAYQAKDYSTAAAKFAEAYGLDPDPVYLFNAAQAYRFGNDCKRAADYYRLFQQKVPKAPNKAQVSEWLDAETRCVEEHDRAAKAQADDLAKPHYLPAPKGPDHRAAYAVGAAGVLSLGLGVYFSFHVHSIQQQHDTYLSSHCQLGAPCDGTFVTDTNKHFQDRADAAVRDEAICYALGAVALAASTYLYVRANHHAREEQPAVSFAPLSGGGMVVGGLRF